MVKLLGIICIFYVVGLNTVATETPTETDAEIRNTILAGYDKSLPPILFSTQHHYTFTGFNVLRIRGVDERKGEFIVEGPIVAVWQDQRLFWANYRLLRVSSKDIWIPALYVYNRVEPDELTVNPFAIVVFGDVIWAPRYTLRTGCNFNLKYYPFDTQVCDVILTYGSPEGDYLPINSSRPMIVKKAFILTDFMIENTQWSPKSQTVHTEVMNVGSDTKREVLVYRFTIERSMCLVPLGILTPCISCVLLLLTTYWMPAGSTLRSGISITSMIVSSTSLFTLAKLLPANGSSTPIIVEYVSVTLILSAVSSIQAMAVSILRRYQKPPPVSYTTIILKIPRLCLFLLGISPEKTLTNQLDEKFLFSELDDPENRNTPEAENNVTEPGENSSQVQSVRSLWLKYIVLFDRVMFYILGVVILLFVVSVIITE